MLNISYAIQHWYFSKNGQLVKRYSWMVETQGADSTRKYIVNNRNLVSRIYGRTLVREFIINYRSRFDVSNPNKLYNNFLKYISTKSIHHSSDVAIACNIVKNARLTEQQQHVLLDFAISRLGERLPNVSRLSEIKILNIKKCLVFDKVNELKILKQ